MNNTIKIILILAIAYILFNYLSQTENFTSDMLYDYPNRASGRARGQINTTPIIAIAKHIRVNKFNEVDDISTKPPLPREGEVECAKMNCPNYYPSDAVCWKCS